MSNGRYILHGHEPVLCEDLRVWDAWSEHNAEEVVVGRDMVGDRDVSTVFLGLDQNRPRRGKPVLFETLVFGDPEGVEQHRYCTWDEAEAGHKAVVERLKGNL